MDKEKLLDVSKTLNCEYEIGIWSETDDFLERQEGVSKFSIKYDNGQYNVNITLKDFNPSEAVTVFDSLVKFIEYSKSTFYVRDNKQSSIEYYLLSSTVDKKAFLMHIIFQ
ncbi:MAG: hypothetical protein K0R46_3259 [Herbinix sp.]|jgi:hypothetical protein|nr:hypothetical protein [Herbinix sp.]